MATSSHHVILFVIIQRHSTKSTSTYHFIPTDFSPHPSIAKYCIDKKLARSYYQPSLQFQSHLFHIRNHTEIGLPYKALQLRKAHKTEPA